MGHDEVQYKKMSNYVHRQWKVTSYLSVQLMWSRIVQCSDNQVSWITLTDELSWSSHVHSIHSRANSTLDFLRSEEEPSALSCQTLNDLMQYHNNQY